MTEGPTANTARAGGLDPVPRIGGRVLLLDSGNRLLLIHERIESGTHWLTPGGGVEPGETLQQAAAREVFEETSIRVDLDVTAEPVHVQRRSWHWNEVTYDQTDYFYVVRVSTRPPVAPAALTPMERETLIEHRWWSVGEIRASAGAETFEPPDLADVIEGLMSPPTLTA